EKICGFAAPAQRDRKRHQRPGTSWVESVSGPGANRIHALCGLWSALVQSSPDRTGAVGTTLRTKSGRSLRSGKKLLPRNSEGSSVFDADGKRPYGLHHSPASTPLNKAGACAPDPRSVLRHLTEKK